jgi:cytochrome P450
MTSSVEVDFFDPAVNECPYPAYQALRDEAPVWKDPKTGMYVVTRFDDVRMVLTDTERFSNDIGSAATRRQLVRPDNPEQARGQAETAARTDRVKELYEEKGWLPAPNLDALDEPEHGQRRQLFDDVFKPIHIKKLDPIMESITESLFDRFIDNGSCEWVSQLAVPLPLRMIGWIVGVPEEDLARIKVWTDAGVRRMKLVQTEEETLYSVEMEIEMQHYFQARFEQLREQPDETFLSALVNTEVPGLGRTMTDRELHGEMMSDIFIGGAETTTNALSEGVALLIRHPAVWRALKDDPVGLLPTFVEEVLRLESPVQSLLRKASVDVELHGVTIPAGAVVNIRYGAANRDERMFGSPDEIDLRREKPRRHLAFGTGIHHCLGAPLARRELHFGFKALIERIDELWFLPDANTFEHQENYFLRALKELHIGFTPTERSPRDGRAA